MKASHMLGCTELKLLVLGDDSGYTSAFVRAVTGKTAQRTRRPRVGAHLTVAPWEWRGQRRLIELWELGLDVARGNESHLAMHTYGIDGFILIIGPEHQSARERVVDEWRTRLRRHVPHTVPWALVVCGLPKDTAAKSIYVHNELKI